MKCPVCNEPDLVMTERQGVEIDYCPKCRGVWLDRGELDKIIERSVPSLSTMPSGGLPQSIPPAYGFPPRGHHDDDHGHGYEGHHRKKSWLSEIFD